MIQAILTDIEGTTTQLSFVKEVLFPYAYQHLPDYILQHRQDPQVIAILQQARDCLQKKNLTEEDLIQEFLHWIETDQKITPLKTLQGLIWQDGYEKGEIISHVYADVIQNLKSWHAQNKILAIFSSGSILAQKLLFAHTEAGDLTPLFSYYFDTTTGAKNNPESYEIIAQHLRLPAADILFLSDSQAELDAASKAGMQTLGLVRDAAVTSIHKHLIANNFNEVIL